MPIYRKSSKSKVYKKKRTYKKKVPVSLAVKSYVKKALAINEENKTSYNSQSATTINAYDPITQSLSLYDVTQTLFLSQGVGAGQRIGNKVSVKSLLVKGFINITGTAVTSNLYFRVAILRKKTGVDSPNGSFAQLFQLGSGVSAPTGTLLDMMRPFNKDFYTVYASKICIIGSSDSATSIMPGNNTTMSKMFSFNLSKHCSKIIYNDGTTFPTNIGFYLIIIPCNANGIAVTSGQLSLFSSTWESNVLYEDA